MKPYNSRVQSLDTIMEQASEALVKMDYFTTEALASTAFEQAMGDRCYAYAARILMPLQEARRQIRMIAAEGPIHIGSAALEGGPGDWLAAQPVGCLVVTPPHTEEQAAECYDRAREARQPLEVLYAPVPGQPQWTLASFRGRGLRATVAAPPSQWQAFTPADWFLDALEALGDAGVHQARETSDPLDRVAILRQSIAAAPHHEILHQELGALLRELAVAHAGMQP